MKQTAALILAAALAAGAETADRFSPESAERKIWMEFAPSLAVGNDFPFSDAYGIRPTVSIFLEPAVYVTPKLGLSLNIGYQFGPYFEKNSYSDPNDNTIIPLHDFLGGVGIKTRRTAKKSGSVVPFNTLLEAGITSFGTASDHSDVLPLEFRARFQFESGIEKKIDEKHALQILGYIGGNMFFDGWPIPMPAAGIKIEPIFRSSAE